MHSSLSPDAPLPLGGPSVTQSDADLSRGGDARLVELVEAAKRGERDAFGRIYDEFQLPVYRYARARLRIAADAEDAAAETFIAAFRAIGRYTWSGMPFEAWLFRIARSKVVDQQRRMARRRTTDLDAADPGSLPRADDVASVAMARQDSEALFAAMRRLSGDQQEVLAMRFFAGLSVAETAEAMGRSAQAVKQLQFRAVTALRDRMAREP